MAIVFKELIRVDGSNAIRTIGTIPNGLSELYHHLMTKIELEDEFDRPLCKRVLAATLLAYRPLSHFELALLANLRDADPERIVVKCGSLPALRPSNEVSCRPGLK